MVWELCHWCFSNLSRDSARLDIWTEAFIESQDSPSESQICLETQPKLQLIESVKASFSPNISQAKSLPRSVFIIRRSYYYSKFLPEFAGLRQGLTCVSQTQRSVSSPCVSAPPLSLDPPPVFLPIPPSAWTVVQSEQYKNHPVV